MGLFSLIGGIISGNKQAKAADRAAQLQYDATEMGIEESARQYDQTRSDFEPYREAGVDALDPMRGLIGLNGADEQEAAIMALRDSPMYQSLYNNGEEAILANASATGGLRGGNTQRGLADFGADTLSTVIRQQLADYGGMVGVGSGATDAVASYGQQAVAAQSQLRNQGAGANAQAALVRGSIAGQNWANAGSFLDDAIGQAIGGFSKGI